MTDTPIKTTGDSILDQTDELSTKEVTPESLDYNGVANKPSRPHFYKTAGVVASLDKINSDKIDSEISRKLVAPSGTKAAYFARQVKNRGYDIKSILRPYENRIQQQKVANPLLLTIGAMASVDSNRFQLGPQLSYMRKNLSLSFYSAGQLKTISTMLLNMGAMLETKLEAIKLNTAAPERKKETLADKLKEIFHNHIKPYIIPKLQKGGLVGLVEGIKSDLSLKAAGAAAFIKPKVDNRKSMINRIRQNLSRRFERTSTTLKDIKVPDYYKKKLNDYSDYIMPFVPKKKVVSTVDKTMIVGKDGKQVEIYGPPEPPKTHLPQFNSSLSPLLDMWYENDQKHQHRVEDYLEKIWKKIPDCLCDENNKPVISALRRKESPPAEEEITPPTVMSMKPSVVKETPESTPHSKKPSSQKRTRKSVPPIAKKPEIPSAPKETLSSPSVVSTAPESNGEKGSFFKETLLPLGYSASRKIGSGAIGTLKFLHKKLLSPHTEYKEPLVPNEPFDDSSIPTQEDKVKRITESTPHVSREKESEAIQKSDGKPSRPEPSIMGSLGRTFAASSHYAMSGISSIFNLLKYIKDTPLKPPSKETPASSATEHAHALAYGKTPKGTSKEKEPVRDTSQVKKGGSFNILGALQNAKDIFKVLFGGASKETEERVLADSGSLLKRASGGLLRKSLGLAGGSLKLLGSSLAPSALINTARSTAGLVGGGLKSAYGIGRLITRIGTPIAKPVARTAGKLGLRAIKSFARGGISSVSGMLMHGPGSLPMKFLRGALIGNASRGLSSLAEKASGYGLLGKVAGMGLKGGSLLMDAAGGIVPAIAGMTVGHITDSLTKKGTLGNLAGHTLAAGLQGAAYASILGPEAAPVGFAIGSIIELGTHAKILGSGLTSLYHGIVGSNPKVSKDGKVISPGSDGLFGSITHYLFGENSHYNAYGHLIPSKEGFFSRMWGGIFGKSSNNNKEWWKPNKHDQNSTEKLNEYAKTRAQIDGKSKAVAQGQASSTAFNSTPKGHRGGPITGSPHIDIGPTPDLTKSPEYKSVYALLKSPVQKIVSQSKALQFVTWTSQIQDGTKLAAQIINENYSPNEDIKTYIRKIYQVRSTRFINDSGSERAVAFQQLGKEENFANQIQQSQTTGSPAPDYGSYYSSAGQPMAANGDATSPQLPGVVGGNYNNVKARKISSAQTNKNAVFAINYLMKKGWTKAQASGIIGNLVGESGINPIAIGDGGLAHGIAQWHPDRQQNIINALFPGKKFSDLTLAQQLDGLNWELHHTEIGAGNRLKKAKTPEQAAAIVTQYYERPADPTGQSIIRAGYAKTVYALSNGIDNTKMQPLNREPNVPSNTPKSGPQIASNKYNSLTNIKSKSVALASGSDKQAHISSSGTTSDSPPPSSSHAPTHTPATHHIHVAPPDLSPLHTLNHKLDKTNEHLAKIHESLKSSNATLESTHKTIKEKPGTTIVSTPITQNNIIPHHKDIEGTKSGTRSGLSPGVSAL